ncbi:MAG: DDE-type integrase/transposase/recombinase [Anaerocolumna sp.]|jgi:hypothetical protein|nr:DDE-type integrase/transposase/recombinase [Anaerocolumna sp.]
MKKYDKKCKNGDCSKCERENEKAACPEFMYKVSQRENYNNGEFSFAAHANARYIEQDAPNYNGPPLIEALPTQMNSQELLNALGKNPKCSSSEREMSKDFLYNFKRLTPSTTNGIFSPGYRAQINSTECPTELLKCMNNKSIGKATTYHIVDEFSTLIIGLSVIIGKASWDGVSSAILNCIEDKVEFCARHGLNIDTDKWPNTRLPRVMLTDRGTEFTGYQAKYMVENLRVVIQNAPPRRPYYKPFVEQSYNTTEIKMRTWVPGIGKRGDHLMGGKDPKEAAKMDIEDMMFIYLTLAVHHNNKIIPDHPYADELRKEGIIPTPVNLYLWGQKEFGDGGRDFDKDFIKLVLLRRGTATVDERGGR